MVPLALAGMAAWAVAGLALLPARGWLSDHGHSSWLWTCLAGFLLGLPGLAVMYRHDAHRATRRAGSARRPATGTAGDRDTTGAPDGLPATGDDRQDPGLLS